MPGKRQRGDAYQGLTYLQLNADNSTQQIIQGEGRGRIVSLTRKSSVKQKRPENACVRVTSVASTQLCRAPSSGAALNANRRREGTEIVRRGFRPWCCW